MSVLVDPRAIIDRVVAGDPAAAGALVHHLAPVVRRRIAGVLARRSRRGRSFAPDLDDLVQDTWVALFDRGARALRAWDPARGLDLGGFVGLFAARTAAMRLRTRKTNPWTEDPTTADLLAELGGTAGGVAASLEARCLLAQIRARLGAQGRRYFQLLFIDDESVEAAAAAAGTSRDALYAWRSRLTRLAHELAALNQRDRAVPARRSCA
jgi:RNA polymerase sigma-70 factor (ECF subfamily)